MVWIAIPRENAPKSPSRVYRTPSKFLIGPAKADVVNPPALPRPNPGQTPAKPRPNPGQTPAKPRPNPGQTPAKPRPNPGQTPAKPRQTPAKPRLRARLRPAALNWCCWSGELEPAGNPTQSNLPSCVSPHSKRQLTQSRRTSGRPPSTSSSRIVVTSPSRESFQSVTPLPSGKDIRSPSFSPDETLLGNAPRLRRDRLQRNRPPAKPLRGIDQQALVIPPHLDPQPF